MARPAPTPNVAATPIDTSRRVKDGEIQVVKRRAGIKDVAALAGVSPATVSRALNENLSDLVAAETRARVLAAVESLKYSANPLAVGMLKGRSLVVAMVVDGLSDPYPVGRMIDGAQRAFWNRDILLAVTSAAVGSDRMQRVFDRLYQRRVDGAIYATTSRSRIDIDIDAGLPLVLLNTEGVSMAAPCVIPDEAGGVDTAVTELLHAGHQRVGFVAAEGTDPSGEKFFGYCRALGRLGLEQDPQLVVADDAPTARGGGRSVGRLLRQAGRPTAVLCDNKAMAVGAYQAAAESGLHVPRDLSVVAFDNDDPAGADALSPPLTTVALPHFEMGSRAAHLMLDLIEGRQTPAGETGARVLVPCHLNRRRSVTEPP